SAREDRPREDARAAALAFRAAEDEHGEPPLSAPEEHAPEPEVQSRAVVGDDRHLHPQRRQVGRDAGPRLRDRDDRRRLGSGHAQEEGSGVRLARTAMWGSLGLIGWSVAGYPLAAAVAGRRRRY